MCERHTSSARLTDRKQPQSTCIVMFNYSTIKTMMRRDAVCFEMIDCGKCTCYIIEKHKNHTATEPQVFGRREAMAGIFFASSIMHFLLPATNVCVICFDTAVLPFFSSSSVTSTDSGWPNNNVGKTTTSLTHTFSNTHTLDIGSMMRKKCVASKEFSFIRQSTNRVR